MTLDGMKQDQQTVTSNGTSLAKMPHGMRIRELVLHTDDRGMVFEMFDPRWGFHDEPIGFVYSFTVRPGMIKGWGMHKQHEDRYCLMLGELELVTYDARPDSPTFGLVSKIYLTEQRRMLVNVPAGVWHADRNIGTKDAFVVNFPTILYDHTSPDKYRLPLDTDLIPHKFPNPQGW